MYIYTHCALTGSRILPRSHLFARRAQLSHPVVQELVVVMSSLDVSACHVHKPLHRVEVPDSGTQLVLTSTP